MGNEVHTGDRKQLRIRRLLGAVDMVLFLGAPPCVPRVVVIDHFPFLCAPVRRPRSSRPAAFEIAVMATTPSTRISRFPILPRRFRQTLRRPKRRACD